MNLKGKQTWQFKHDIYLSSCGTAVGPIEKEGPLGKGFDITYDSLYCGEKNWELAERRLMTDAIEKCLEKKHMTKQQIDFLLAGDLLNQIVTSNFVAREMEIPFLGMFGACSTSMETLALSAVLVDGGYANNVIAAASSHNATAERQFRYPTEYGGQKPDTATFTVTGAGAALVNKDKSPIRIKEATIGRVIDLGIKNPFDMGSAMAPAASDTIINHFKDTGKSPSDYDLIVTGDLSRVGSAILQKLVEDEGYNFEDNYSDCGIMIYSPDQPVFAGGSGCACSAVVTYGHLIDEMKKGNLNRIFVVATGALLSPLMIQQKETIPCIAHGVVLETVGVNQSD